MNKQEFMKVVSLLHDAIEGSIFLNKVYCVGGSVRDFILQRDIKDIDIAVEMPNGGIALAEYLRKKLKCDSCPIIFPKYGTAKLDVEVKDYGIVPIEFVQCRKEWYTDGSRKPSSIAVGSIKDDAERRDLTINALYINVTSYKIEDPTENGKNDMMKHLLRCTNKPNEVFKDDALRMLRVVRFKSQLGWNMDKETYLGILHNANLISSISQERITSEFSKILLSNKPSEGINMLRFTTLLKHIMPYMVECKNLIVEDPYNSTLYEHTLNVLDKTQPILEHRLAALFHDFGKLMTYKKNFLGKVTFADHDVKSTTMARVIMSKMCFSNKTIEKVTFAILNHHRFDCYNASLNNMSDRSVRRICNQFGDNFDLITDLIKADMLANSIDEKKKTKIDYFLERVNKLKEKDGDTLGKANLPIDGNDIIKHFNLRKGGPIISKFLNLAKSAYFSDPKITKEEMLVFLDSKKHLILKK